MLELDRLLNIRLLGHRVLLHRLELPERSAGGIYIIGREWPAIAQVLAVGSGLRRRKLAERIPIDDISVGDYVAFGRYEFEKWIVLPEYAIMPVDRLQYRIKEL